MTRRRSPYGPDVLARAIEMDKDKVPRTRISAELGVSCAWLTRWLGRGARKGYELRRYNSPIGPPSPADPVIVAFRSMLMQKRTGPREIRTEKVAHRVVKIRREIISDLRKMGLNGPAIASLVGMGSSSLSVILRGENQ